MTYNPNNDTWTQTGQLPEVMQHMAHDYTPGVGLIVSGGNFDGGRGKHINSTYQSKDGGVTFNKLPDLPGWKPEAGCVVIVSDDEMFRLGGRYKNLPGNGWMLPVEEVYSFKFSTNQWTKKADISVPAKGHSLACGLVTLESGEKEIVTQINDKVGIYNIATNTWREAPNFPTRLRMGATTRYGDTFLIVAGHDDNGTTREEKNPGNIWEYVPKNETFVKLPQKINYIATDDFDGHPEGHGWMGTMLLPDNICD